MNSIFTIISSHYKKFEKLGQPILLLESYRPTPCNKVQKISLYRVNFYTRPVTVLRFWEFFYCKTVEIGFYIQNRGGYTSDIQ